MNRLAEFFEERTGGLSMTRLTIGLLVTAYIVWGSWIVYQTKAIPDMPVQVMGLLVLLYGINKTDVKIGIGQPKTEGGE